MLSIQLVLVLLYSLINCSSTGSSLCNAKTETIAFAMGQPSALGYSADIETSSTSNSFKITLKNTKGLASFQGILMYVMSKGNESFHRGSFQFPSNNKYKSVPSWRCQLEAVTGESLATITHQNSNSVNLPETFTWTASSSVEAARSDLVLVLVVAIRQTASSYPSWERVADISLRGSAAVSTIAEESFFSAPVVVQNTTATSTATITRTSTTFSVETRLPSSAVPIQMNMFLLMFFLVFQMM
jgi:hypothetical protein